MPLLLIVLLFGVMYFLMIRPQQKRRREALQMQSELDSGDQIVTIGGLHGTVVAVADDVVTLEVAPGVNVRFARAAIARVLPRESAESTDAADAEFTDVEPVEEPRPEPPIQSPVVETRKSSD